MLVVFQGRLSNRDRSAFLNDGFSSGEKANLFDCLIMTAVVIGAYVCLKGTLDP